jgi:anti-anti-sigma factor
VAVARSMTTPNRRGTGTSPRRGLLASSVAMAEPTRPDAVAPARLEITTATADGGTVLTLSGELDIASAPALERTLDDFGAPLPRRLVIDLTEVTFMDSTGLRALLLARQRAVDGDHELLLCPGPRQVQRVLELSGTLERFSFQDPPAGA